MVVCNILKNHTVLIKTKPSYTKLLLLHIISHLIVGQWNGVTENKMATLVCNWLPSRKSVIYYKNPFYSKCVYFVKDIELEF